MSIDRLNTHFGCIADDFTGASDWASFYAANGAKVYLNNGIVCVNDNPDTVKDDHCMNKNSDHDDYQVHPEVSLVIAQKSRSVAPLDAKRLVSSALTDLQSKGYKRFYFKYCSTFDSTPTGNIGPCADLLLESLDLPYTILAPSLPANGRTVEDGILYVNGIPLAESHMRDHPLNPMKDSSIIELMKPQSRYPTYILKREIYNDEDCLEAFLSELMTREKHFYLVPDYSSQEDGKVIAKRFQKLPLLTGGSGLAECISLSFSSECERYKNDHNCLAGSLDSGLSTNLDRSIILVGSMSEATRAQVKKMIDTGFKYQFINLSKLRDDPSYYDDLCAHLNDQKPILFASEASAGGKKESFPEAALMLENCLADLAETAYNLNYTNFIVAGGESSGAVAKRLAWDRYEVGPSIAPGVPVLFPVTRGIQENICVVYKSGNFGDDDFFRKALDIMSIPRE